MERRRIRRRNRQRRDRNNIEDVRIIAVLGMIAMNPYVSTRQMQRVKHFEKHSFQITTISLLTIYHYYHVTLTQALSNNDMIRRVEFCR